MELRAGDGAELVISRASSPLASLLSLSSPPLPKHHHDIPSLKQSIFDMADKKYNVAIIGYGYVNPTPF
jgi:hypothetical protein